MWKARIRSQKEKWIVFPGDLPPDPRQRDTKQKEGSESGEWKHGKRGARGGTDKIKYTEVHNSK